MDNNVINLKRIPFIPKLSREFKPMRHYYCETETSEYYYSYYTKDGKKVKKGSDDQGTSKKGIFTNRANV